MSVGEAAAIVAVATPLVVMVYQIGRLAARVEALELRAKDTDTELAEVWRDVRRGRG